MTPRDQGRRGSPAAGRSGRSAPPKKFAVQFGTEVPLSAIVVDETHQRRKGYDQASLRALAESLVTLGQQQNCIGVRREDGRIQLVAGFRRYFAAKLAGLKTLHVLPPAGMPADIVPRPSQLLLLNQSENMVREGLTTYEVATGLAATAKEMLDEAKRTVPPTKLPLMTLYEMIGRSLGLSKQTVGQYLRYVEKLHPDVQEVWANSPSLMPIKVLDQLVTKTHAQQIAIVREMIAEASGDSELPAEGRGSPPATTKKVRMRPTAQLLTTYRLLQGADQNGFAAEWSAEFRAGAKHVLGWAFNKHELDEFPDNPDAPAVPPLVKMPKLAQLAKPVVQAVPSPSRRPPALELAPAYGDLDDVPEFPE